MVTIPNYLNDAEKAVIRAVMREYELVPEEEEEVWRRIIEICEKTTGRFYAYATAHSLCPTVRRETKWRKPK